ncbi:hypothetical protein GCM10010172_05480 [Paractinoplanes ferrugineus]|uniref:FAD dependent oxidoreductase domain-containing protein n=1 Tax=Paractinoplanes ferrugineus TaxID=113564 RepID=A0A919J146_9ACTN|nr:FAD-dependent oxidoreductase [Actinoplanes ferrugineus]GIE12535.1 hypothetical protein Afe05nite_43750 [Actinoplanes ferrugineus]
MKPVVVVGTGIVGASIAHHLTRTGVPVTVVGRDGGATASSFGWIGGGDRGHWPGGAADLSGLVVDDWRRLEQEVPGLGLRRTGSLRWPVTDDTGTDLVDSNTIAHLEPALRAVPDRASHDPRDAGVDAPRAARTLLLAARDAGAHVYYGTTVTHIHTDGVSTSAGLLPASTVVLAAGAGTAALTRHLTDPARIADTSSALLIRVRAETGLVRGIIATPQLEVREVRDRELLITAPLGDTWTWTDLRTAARHARHELATTFGDGRRMLRGWRVGTRPMPARGPLIGRLTPHVYAAVMHSGVCLAPSVGRLAAAEITSGTAAPELSGCR